MSEPTDADLDALAFDDAGESATRLVSSAEFDGLMQRRARFLKQLAEAAAYVKQFEERLKAIDEVELPALFDKMGVSKVTLASGEVVTLEQVMTASLANDETRKRAILFLDRHGCGDIVQTSLEIVYPKSMRADAARTRELLASRNIPFKDHETVNTGTYKATLKELMGQGKAIPTDIGAFVVRKAVVK